MAVRCIDGASHPILVDAHVAVRHGDRVDVGIDDRPVPGGGVREAVDVVPSAGIEADEVRAERRANFHELEGRLDLLDEHVDFDHAVRQAEMALERVKDLLPQRRFFGRLDLRQVEHEAPPFAPKDLVIVDDVQGHIDDGRGQRVAVGPAHVAIVEVESARAEDPRREIELGPPVLDGPAAEEPLRPGVHLARDLLGDGHERRVARERQPEVALVVERHAVDLAEGVFTVKHPPVCAGKEGIGDIPNAVGRRRTGPCRRAGPLDPLTLQVGGDVAPVEPSGPRVAHADGRPADRGVCGQKRDSLPLTCPSRSPLDARLHQLPAVGIEVFKRRHRVERRGREHVTVAVEQIASYVE